MKRLFSAAAQTFFFCAAFLWGSNESPRSTAQEQVKKEEEKQPAAAKSNKLANEKSPYLLQHAKNPVNWYPWGTEAFEKAKRENKPVFLSVGYSTCHWCHVMEKESFDDEEVAKLMNDTFVCIKVDREERPDIDNVYMEVCQMMTQRGGWPLTIIMTPDKKPFYAGTYLPKKSRPGMMGMVDLVPRVADFWKNGRDELQKHADSVTDVLTKLAAPTPGDPLGEPILQAAYDQFVSRFDAEQGGFVGSPTRRFPKFPTPHNLMFLLRWHARTQDEQALKMVETTLRQMRLGGMYDHVGFGFHRYSTDANWLVPHFEKMLYDQALLIMAYTEAYQATGNPFYQKTAREIITYVLRDMTSPEGGFYSAEDADSEGEEGKFYVWSVKELADTLTEEEGNLYGQVYNFAAAGNFVEQLTGEKTGTNIPHLTQPLAAVAESMKLKPEELTARLEAIRQKLFAAREKRVHAYKDDKIMTDWNGLMIAALSKAGQAFDEPTYTTAARRAADFVLAKLRTPEGRLLHRFRLGEAGLQANVDDYAFMIWGLLETYEASFEPQYLEQALALNEQLLKHFWDEASGGLYFSANDAEELLVRKKEIYDGAIPSGNSVALLNWLRLARITGREELTERCSQLTAAFSKSVTQSPSSHAFLLSAVDFQVGPSLEIVLVGRPASLDSRNMLLALRRRYLPNKVVLFRSHDADPAPLVRLAPFLKSHTSADGTCTAYVCRNYACQLPTTEVDKMLEFVAPPKKEEAD